MRFFRRRHARAARLKSVPLIYEDDRALLDGKREKLGHSEEVLDNLAASLGVTRPEGCGGAGCLGCATVYVLALGNVFIALGIFMMVMGIGWLLQSRHLEPNTSLPALLLVVGMIFLLPGGGPQYILYSHAAEQRQVYLTSLYNQLVTQGQVVEGIITRVEPVVIGEVISKQIILHYRFTVPDQPGEYEGQYKLWPAQVFETGQKVTVLYLNRFVQVLL